MPLLIEQILAFIKRILGSLKMVLQVFSKSSLSKADGNSASDTGEGMNKKEISYLFESFSRGKAGTKFWTEGAGLGLYIAKKFVEMHKGKIWAKSEGKETGSIFYVELPTK